MSIAGSRKPRYKKGQTVMVDSRPPLGHCRTPWYVRGKSGTISAVQGVLHDPSRLAYHRPGLPAQVLYKVKFRQSDLWPGYRGPAGDHLEADLQEDWLTAADAPSKGGNR